MTILDTPIWTDKNFCCTSTTTTGDVLKLTLPVMLTAYSIGRALEHLIEPLSQHDRPQWGISGLYAVTALASLGFTVAVFNFHRKDIVFGKEETIYLTIHGFLSFWFLLISIACLVFFKKFAPELDKCAHDEDGDECGDDVIYSGGFMGVSLLWLLVTGLGYRRMNVQQEATATASGMEKRPSANADEDNEFELPL